MRTKIARALLRQRDPRQRQRLLLRSYAAFLLFFAAYCYFCNLSSPLKLIPQTFTGLAMGYLMLSITALRQFKYVTEFIDWARVSAVVEPSGPADGSPPSRSV